MAEQLGRDIEVPIDIGGGDQNRCKNGKMWSEQLLCPNMPCASQAPPTDGPMLGFALSEHEGLGHVSLSADIDMDASSDRFGLGLGANMSLDMDFIMPFHS